MKKVILGNNLQGIDYTYTIDGALKGINHADPAIDPGTDGTDVFGETLHYFDGDYQNANNTSTGNLSATANNQFSGLLKATSWHSPSSNQQMNAYQYSYDSRNQLLQSTFGSVTGSGGSYSHQLYGGVPYREKVDSYDKNGNIQKLYRFGKKTGVDGNGYYTADQLALYDYIYEANTNKLDKVNNTGTLMTDFTYNSIGQMTKQEEGGKVFNISYNVHGLVKEVRDNNNTLVQTYHYDDRGNLLQKATYPSGVKYTTYISDVAGNVLAIYYQSGTTTLASQPAEVPVYGAGRIALHKPAVNTYFYEVNDHLGNVRAVIGVPSTLNYTANLETGLSGSGEGVFNNYSSNTYDLVDHTDEGTTYQQVQLLNGGVSGRVGLAKSFSVSPGDKVKIEAYAKYRNLTGNANGTSFVTALASAFGVSSSSTGEQLKIYNGLNYYGGTVPGGDHLNDNESAPKVFVTVILFDKNYNLSDAGWDQIDLSAEQVSGTTKTPPLHDLLSKELTVTEPGYAYVFVSNEHPTYVDAYFDDVSVTHTQSQIVAGADYYPFGLAMENREITDESYRYGYQGQFSEKDLTTGQNEFELRNYDARIGRWLSTDPYGQYASPYLAMGNNPHMSVDPNGGIDLPAVTITATSYATIAANIATTLARSMATMMVFSGGCPPNCDPPGYTDRRGMNDNKYIGPNYPSDTPGYVSSTGSVNTSPLSEGLANYKPQITSTISAYKPNFFAQWNASSIPGSSFTYNIVNGAYIGFSSFFLKPFIGNDVYNLDNSYASYRDRQIGFVSTAAMFVPVLPGKI